MDELEVGKRYEVHTKGEQPFSIAVTEILVREPISFVKAVITEGTWRGVPTGEVVPLRLDDFHKFVPLSGEEKYPECEKLSAVSDQSQVIGEFIDWLGETHAAEIGVWRKDHMVPIGIRMEQLLAEFFGIDLEKVEEERRAMLEGMSS